MSDETPGCEHHLVTANDDGVLGYCSLPADHGKYGLEHKTVVNGSACDGEGEVLGQVSIEVSWRVVVPGGKQ